MGGISLLPTDITRRRPSGGEGSSRRFLVRAPEAEEGRAAGDEGASPPLATGSAADAEAKVAWCRAALALALAFFAGPRRRRCWPTEAGGVDSVGDNDESSSDLGLTGVGGKGQRPAILLELLEDFQ